MSTCISRHGEYDAHEPDEEFTCTICGAVDEEAMREELRRLRRRDREVRAQALRDAAHDWPGTVVTRKPVATWLRDRADAEEADR